MKNPNPDPARHADIPVWNAENWMYEDIVIGHRIRSIRRTLSEGECMQFNALVLDMHPYVADEIFAKEEGIFGRRLVAGAMVFSVGLGLVATNCVNAFSYGYDKLRFIKPVFIGDTIYTIKTDLEKAPKYPEMGLYRASYEVFKNAGELVLYCEHLQTVKYRDPAACRAPSKSLIHETLRLSHPSPSGEIRRIQAAPRRRLARRAGQNQGVRHPQLLHLLQGRVSLFLL